MSCISLFLSYFVDLSIVILYFYCEIICCVSMGLLFNEDCQKEMKVSMYSFIFFVQNFAISDNSVLQNSARSYYSMREHRPTVELELCNVLDYHPILYDSKLMKVLTRSFTC